MPDNQTRAEWLNLPTVVNNPSARGTGVILTSTGNKQFAEGIEYEALIQQASDNDFEAFSWVPHSVATEAQVKGATCQGLRCVPASCPPGCVCSRRTGRCR
jgi:hypothetical protein